MKKHLKELSMAQIRALFIVSALLLIFGICKIFGDGGTQGRITIWDGQGNARSAYVDSQNRLTIVDTAATNLLQQILDGVKSGPTNTVQVSLTNILSASLTTNGLAQEVHQTNILARLITLNAKDFSTETTLSSLLGVNRNATNWLDLMYQRQALQATAANQSVQTNQLNTANGYLATISAKDFSTETTLGTRLSESTFTSYMTSLTNWQRQIFEKAAAGPTNTVNVNIVGGSSGGATETNLTARMSSLLSAANTHETNFTARTDIIISAVDGVEGYIDGIEGSLTSILSSLGNIETYVDGIEGLLGTSNTNTGASATSLSSIDAKITALQAQVDSVTNRLGQIQRNGSPVTNNNAVALTVASTNITGFALDTTLQRMTNQLDSATNLLVKVTNNLAPSTVAISWNPAAGLNSNLVASAATTLTWLTAVNTNTATVQLTAYDSASVPVLGTTPTFSWVIPYATNGAGIVIPIPGGHRFSSGLAFWVTKGGTTNTVPVGPIYVNGGCKP